MWEESGRSRDIEAKRDQYSLNRSRHFQAKLSKTERRATNKLAQSRIKAYISRAKMYPWLQANAWSNRRATKKSNSKENIPSQIRKSLVKI